MSKIKIINMDSAMCSACADMIFTDPPYEMNGYQLYSILSRYNSNHILLITTMRQLFQFIEKTDFELSFDFVLDSVVPKKSKSIHQPNYTHQNVVYLKKIGEKSIFNRKLRQRSDTFDNNGYWPTVLRASRNNMKEHGMGKNLNSITDILGSFEVKSIIDPFAGIGTIALAAQELGIDCTMIEIETNLCLLAKKKLKFIGATLT